MEKLPYRWGTDFLPHDGAHGDFKTGQTAQQILEDMGREVEVLERAGLESDMAAKADGHATDAALMSDSWPNTSR